MDKKALLKLIDDLTFERTDYVQVSDKSAPTTGMAQCIKHKLSGLLMPIF